MNFSELMNSVSLSGHSASLSVPDDWTQGRTIYGGLQAALTIKAMEQLINDERPLRCFQANFIGPVTPGTVVANAAVLRQGKSSTQVHGEIEEQQQKSFVATAIFAKRRSSELAFSPSPPTPQYPLTACAEPQLNDATRSPFNDHFLSRWPRDIPIYSNSKAVHLNVYVRHKDDNLTSNAHLLALADAIPPLAVTQLGNFAPLSTMMWQLEIFPETNIFADHTDAWYRFDISVNICENGYCSQSTKIWSPSDRLMAISQQSIAVFG